MQPGDLVAIVLTSGSAGALQQFTSDRRILYAAIDRVRWNPRSRGQGEAPAPGFGDSTQTVLGNLQQFREDLFTVGTLGTLKYIVGGMRQLPGRKSVLLFSDGFKIFLTKLPPLNMNNPDTGPDPSETRDRILDSLKRLTDLANRSSVVIYTINASGLKTYNEDAATNLSGSEAYFILIAVRFAAKACCFCWFAAFAFICFCAACFCTAFGDLSPIFLFTFRLLVY